MSTPIDFSSGCPYCGANRISPTLASFECGSYHIVERVKQTANCRIAQLERDLSASKSALEKAMEVLESIASLNQQGGLIGRSSVASAKEALTAINAALWEKA